MRLVLLVCCALLPSVIAGCASLSNSPCCPEEKSAKSLFTWEVGPKEADEKKDDGKKDEKKNGDDKDTTPTARDIDPATVGVRPASLVDDKGTPDIANGKDVENSVNGDTAESKKKPEEPDEIVTDRPDFTEASTTVGKGRVQLEAGYTYSRNRETGVQNSHSYPEALLRVGMFADWFEFRIGQNFSNTRTLGADGGVFSTNGGDDLYLGTKLALAKQNKYLPEMALVIQMTVPTGPKSLTAGRTLPGLNYLYGWDINEFLSVGGSTQGNSAVDDGGHTYLELAQSLTVGYTLTKRLGAYTEWFAFFPSGAIAPGTSAQHYVNGGFTYKVTPLFQVDIRGGKGLSLTADDYFFGAGFAVKY